MRRAWSQQAVSEICLTAQEFAYMVARSITKQEICAMSTFFQGELLIKLVALHSKIQRLLVGPLSCHGISLTEYLVLRQLHQSPNKKLRRIDLAQQVGLSASGVTRLLNPMQKVGLISKEEVARDARVSLVTLTSTGENILKDANISFDQTAQSFLEQINAKEQSNLLKITDALL